MREAAAHPKRLWEEAKSRLGRLDHDDQIELVDLPRDGICRRRGDLGFQGKGTGHGAEAGGVGCIPISHGALRGCSKSPCAARRRTGHSLHSPLKPAQRGLEGPC